MSEKFTQEKFEYFAKVIFNIFPHINYITLNNSENGNNTNYYIKFHKSAVSQHISLDGKHWEFKSEDNLNHSAPIYLKNIQYTPRTNGFYVVERKQTLYAISKLYDVKIDDLISCNKLQGSEIMGFL